MCFRFVLYSHIYHKKKALQIFCAINECDSDCKIGVSYSKKRIKKEEV
jgi:hypothetical protein